MIVPCSIVKIVKRWHQINLVRKFSNAFISFMKHKKPTKLSKIEIKNNKIGKQ